MKKSGEKIRFWIAIWPYLKEYKKQLLFCVFCSLLVGVFVAIQPLVIKYIVDNGISNDTLLPGEKIYFVGALCLLYVAISLARVFFWRMGFTRMFRSLEGALFRLRSKFFSHIQQMSMKFYDSTSAGELFNCVMGTPMANIKNYMNQIFTAVPYQAVSLAISLVALMNYDWVMTVLLFLTALMMAWIHTFSRRKMRKVSTEYIKSESEMSKYLSNTLNGMDAVKLYSIEDDTYRSFRKMLSTMYERGVTFSLSYQKETLKPELVQYLATAVVYFVGAVSCVYRGMSVGVLYAFLSSMATIMGILISWLNMGLTKSSAESGLEKIMAVLNVKTATPEKDEKERAIVSKARELAKKENAPCVAFRDASFAYENRDVFSNLNLSIGYKESVALVGKSGSGKSTIAKLVMRLYDVQKGAVLVHGTDVRDFGLHDLRLSFGVVPQNPFIFSGSIWDNIKIARPTASNKEIIDAMETAKVHEFVNNLEKGWNTVVGDGGLDLSGGQKQRIAIARAILGNPDILIFDEATSALDNISERAIQNAMETLMKTHTVIIIAHRLSTIRHVDRVVVLEDGKILEQGSYDELSKTEGGAFYELLKYTKE